jgi:hypothetical protein
MHAGEPPGFGALLAQPAASVANTRTIEPREHRMGAMVADTTRLRPTRFASISPLIIGAERDFLGASTCALC